MSEVPEDRCGYIERFIFQKTNPFHQSCCWRPTLSDADRCVWHADPDNTDEKTIAALKETRPDPEIRDQTEPYVELLDGSQLAGFEIEDSISLSSVALRKADLADADLTGADLTDADLTGADLTDANLQYADLNDASPVAADLTDANLQYADLKNVNLPMADLTDANLSDSDLSGADLWQADLADADLSGADLTDADLKVGDLTEAHLRKADLTNADASSADFTGANLNFSTLSDLAMDPNTDINDIYAADLPARQPSDDENHGILLAIETGAHYLKPSRWRDDEVTNPQEAKLTHRKIRSRLDDLDLPADIPYHYIRSKQASRREAIKTREYQKWLTLSLSRWVTLYGESPWRVVYTSAAVMLGCALAYASLGGIEFVADGGGFAGPNWLKPLYFSVITFTTLGYGDVRPVGEAAQLLSMGESLIGAALIALLVAVLSRRITR